MTTELKIAIATIPPLTYTATDKNIKDDTDNCLQVLINFLHWREKCKIKYWQLFDLVMLFNPLGPISIQLKEN